MILTLPPQHHLRKTVFHRQKPWSLPQVPGSKPKRKWSCLAPDGNTKMDSEPLMATLGTSLSENMLPSPLFYQVSGIELKDECLVFKWLYPVETRLVLSLAVSQTTEGCWRGSVDLLLWLHLRQLELLHQSLGCFQYLAPPIHHTLAKLGHLETWAFCPACWDFA